MSENNNQSQLYSIRAEAAVIGGLINHPQTLVDLIHLSVNDFSQKPHQIIFSLLKNQILNGQNVDKVVLAQKCAEISLSHYEELSIFDYIDSLSFTKLNKVGIQDLSKDLIKLRIKRELFNSTLEAQKLIINSGEKSINEVISGVDMIYNSKVNSYISDDVPIDLFSIAESTISDRVNNPKNHGISTPFPIFNEMFGNLRVGLTAICGRAKNNKSTILLNMGFGGIISNPKLKILYLDTELKNHDHVFRSIAALSQIHTSYMEEGTWVKNKELADRLQKTLKQVGTLKGRLFHHYIGNKSIEEIINIVRRWYFSVNGRNNECLVILDYIKIGDEKLSNYNGEHQELGRKINALNAISQDLGIPILTSMQLNRSAIIDKREDESAISMTDRLSWFANGVFIFRKKRPEEIAEEGKQFGTHKLIPVVLRYEGKNSGLLDLVNVGSSGRPIYKQNFINFNFSNFLLEEKGTLRDIVVNNNFNKILQDNNKCNPSVI